MSIDRRKVVNDALSKFSFAPKKDKSDDILRLLEKVQQAIAHTTRVITPVVKAGGAIKESDRNGPLRELVFTTLIEQLHTLSSDELLNLSTILIAERIMADVEAAIAHGSGARRAEMLRRVTDLFVGHCPQYSDDEIALFDDVISLLAQEIEVAARITLAAQERGRVRREAEAATCGGLIAESTVLLGWMEEDL